MSIHPPHEEPSRNSRPFNDRDESAHKKMSAFYTSCFLHGRILCNHQKKLRFALIQSFDMLDDSAYRKFIYSQNMKLIDHENNFLVQLHHPLDPAAQEKTIILIM